MVFVDCQELWKLSRGLARESLYTGGNRFVGK